MIEAKDNLKINNHMRNKTFWIPVAIAAAMLIAFVLISIGLKVWTSLEVASQLFAALAGAAVVAVLTLILLHGQSEMEGNMERNSKVFEEKLKIYKDFYSQLCKIVEDGKISKEEELQLEFQVATLAIHTSDEHIKDISLHLKSIILRLKEGKNPVLLKKLFEIGQAFREELYPEQSENIEQPCKVGHHEKETDTNKQECEEDNEADDYPTKLNDYLLEAVTNFESITVSKNEIDLYKRALYIKDLIGNVGAKKWIYNHTTLVCEYFTEKNDKGQYRPTKKRIAMDLTPVDDKLVLNIFTREYDEQATKDLIQGIWKKPIENRPPLQPFRHVLEVFNQSDSDEDIARTIRERMAKVKEYRDNNN